MNLAVSQCFSAPELTNFAVSWMCDSRTCRLRIKTLSSSGLAYWPLSLITHGPTIWKLFWWPKSSRSMSRVVRGGPARTRKMLGVGLLSQDESGEWPANAVLSEGKQRKCDSGLHMFQGQLTAVLRSRVVRWEARHRCGTHWEKRSSRYVRSLSTQSFFSHKL